MNPTDYVHWFRQSSPYINAHRDKTFVIMFEGDAIDDENFTNVVQDIALLSSLGVRLVLVHGARPQIDAVLNKLDIQSRFHNDMRITDREALNAVKAAVGMVKADVESLLSVGLPNSPLHGARIRVVSGNFVTAKPLGVIDGVDFQHTGEVRRVDHQAIAEQLKQRNIVLLSNTGYSPSGEMFNLSVEDVAQNAAIALRADKLILMGMKDGLPAEDEGFMKELTCVDLEDQLHHLQDESRRQAQCALHAVRHGVPRVHIVSHITDGALLQELLTREGSGTLVSQFAYDQLRAARTDDINGIIELLTPLEEKGILVHRSRELLENEVHRFYVIERDGMITACAALYPYSDHQAELACVAVHPDYRGTNRGQRLLEQIEQEARRRQHEQLFVLTTRTAHWFVEHGFVAGSVDQLPQERQQLYNWQRNSKVFFKSL
ncbi:MAG: amino-acid N-acetyltransferase [Oceanospirillaceae bacterium]|uniref:amino-acid N-acetyltransferase n=1 Tax=unclassified Thalassolituus TaxID=2624967 RepID=UPI000C09BA2D|nr:MULTISPECIES: amino-acid N-acetyltransferase [unclassified Thalassolituus]MAK89668.1 amino-acid N-acetyltransferase [Thalassolituus sp.]MAX98455.1 amino-acid N-acetyltransferase [Oceanospirillaceae bacterium]MBL35558.1 amino-acid N-acetyltransferase [Oceanospirillaceae bacterium]MBS51155.1 amino-acid N-acetyltransferase [Oceanospirillaceae bacterium]